jgi:class 3 adenylate cyclase/tetratricopeptide (TPR) repeat protein
VDELAQLRTAAAALEAQRDTLGHEVVEVGLRPLLARIATLESAATDERRLVTTLFADLVGFTTLSERMDPEDVKAVLETYFARWSESIAGRGGVVEKFIGDAVMAVFGLKQAQEDDPERAISAALDMVSSLTELNAELAMSGGPELEMRVGITTGEVVIGAVGERPEEEWLAVGDPINVAARLQAAAPVNGILIAHDTFRHVRGVFDLREVPATTLKGKSLPTRAYVVLGAKPRAFHAVARGVEGVETRMVGRDPELAQLQRAFFAAAQDSDPGMVTVVGDAGIGKSRLLEEFEGWLDLLADEVLYLRGRARQGMERDAFSLIRDVVAFRFAILDTDAPSLVEAKLSAGFGDDGSYLQDIDVASRRWVLAGRLLGFNLGSRTLPGDVEAQAIHELGTLAFVAWIHEAAARRPVVLILDDIHWADDSSLNLAARLVAERERSRILVLCGARPMLYAHRPAWQAGEARHTRIDLVPLSSTDSTTLVTDILQKVRDIPADLRETVVAASEGNPYHVEELLKMLIEDGVIIKGTDAWEVVEDRLPTIRVPSTLVGVVQARIDGLTASEKSVLHRAAVVGRTFWDRAVTAIGDEPAGREDVGPQLGVLRERELVYRREVSSIADATEHIFKHTVLRDVAYQSVLRRLRREYHARAAKWLQSVAEATDRGDEFAAVIAGHYDSAEEAEMASIWYLRAGDAAAARFANAEAMSVLDRALALTPREAIDLRYRVTASRRAIHNTTGERQAEAEDLDELTVIADELDDDRRRSDVELMRAVLASDVGRLADAETHARLAAGLARSAGDTEQEAQALLAIGAGEWKRGNPAAALPVLTEALEIARSGHHDGVAAGCLHSRGVAHHNLGRFGDAEADYRASLQIWNDAGDRSGTSRVLNSLGVLAYDREDFEPARSFLDRALATKRAIGERLGENRVLNNLALVAVAQHNYDTVVESFNRTLKLASVIDDLEGEAASHQGLGYTALRTGRFDEAADHLEVSRRLFAEEGDKQGETQVVLLLAESANARSDVDLAMALAQESADTALAGELPTELAAALAFLGRLHLEAGRFEEAATMLQRSLDLHGDLGSAARVIEVRSALAEAMQVLGRTDEARRLVDEVIEHFKSRGAAGVNEPVMALLACRRVLASQGDPAAHEVTAIARSHLSETAQRLSDPQVRRSYLENVAAHRLVDTDAGP